MSKPFNLQRLQVGVCPFTSVLMVAKNKETGVHEPLDIYREIFVIFNDGSQGAFAVHRDYIPKITQDDIENLGRWQVYTWGLEIIEAPFRMMETPKQLQWYVAIGAHLRIAAWSEFADGLQTEHQEPSKS